MYYKDVNKLIELLKAYTCKGNEFNQYTMIDDTDLADGALTRCHNLRNYLIDNMCPDYILVAESPSTGARYTGIPLTSEKAMDEYIYKSHYYYTSRSSLYRNYLRGERSAYKVWKETSKSSKKFMFWNAFPFNIKSGKSWYSTPTTEQLKSTKYILEAFLKLNPKAEVVALGRKAESALQCLGVAYTKYIHHPSHDYEQEFSKGMRSLL